ncbi:biopolymer transporter ExbD [bacterium]|nr:biopolymer transporter ExbD [bacterium]
MSTPLSEPRESGEDVFDLTPLIDVVFILLLFFLVATTMQVREEEIPIRLPESTAGAPTERAEETLVVSVQPDGTVFLGQDAVALEALVEALKARRARAVVVRGDTETALGRAVQIINLCTEAGVEKITLGTVPEKRP